MSSKPKYFHTTVNAKSPEELAMRVADNESRGFEVVMSKETVKEGTSWEPTEYHGARHRYAGSSSRNVYSALMRRISND